MVLRAEHEPTTYGSIVYTRVCVPIDAHLRMSEQLARKRRLRAGHRASTTQILGRVEPATASDPLNALKINQLKRSLEEKLQCLSDFDQDILDIMPEEAIEDEIVQTDEIKERLYAALLKLDHCLSSLGRTPPTTPPVHANSDLSDVDKFNYLRSLLDGTALDAIAGQTLSWGNYQEAVEVLCKRFGNKQVIISKHMETLMNMEAISSDRHLRNLRRLYDNTESHVRSLKSLGIEAASYGALLSPVLLAKLPPELRLIVSRKVSDSNLNTTRHLRGELMARERANPQQSQERVPHTASTLFSGSRDTNSTLQCSYCQQSHSPTSCSSVINVTTRKQILKTSGRCFNCLRRNHVSRDCKSPSRCLKCKEKHHTSICDTNLASLANTPATISVPPNLRAHRTHLDLC